MSDLQYTLALVEEISGPADTAKAHLEKLRASAASAGKALDFSDQAKRSIEELARIKLDPKGFLAAHEAQKKLVEEQQKLVRGHEGFLGGIKSSITGGSGSGMFSAVALGEAAGEGIAKGAELLVEAAHKVGEIIEEGITRAFEAGGKQERLNTSFKYIFGGDAAAKAAMEQAERLEKRLPFGGIRTAQYVGELGQAGIKGQSAANSLALAADIGAMSPNGQGADEALNSLERLKLHGEFSQRLAEGLKIDLPAFYAALGKKLNMSSAEAQKKLAQPGAIGFNTIQNTLMDLHSKQIGATSGMPAIDQSRELLVTWEKLKELPEEYLRNLANTPGWQALKDSAAQVLAQLDPTSDSGKHIVATLERTFTTLAGEVSDFLQPDNVDQFMAGLGKAATSMENVAHFASATVDFLKEASRVADTLTRPLQYVIEAYDKLHPSTGNDQLDELMKRRAEGMVSPEQVAQVFMNPANHPEDLFKQLNAEQQEQVTRDLRTARPGGGTSVTVPQINVTVNVPEGTPVDEHVAKQIASTTYHHISNFVERMADEDGE